MKGCGEKVNCVQGGITVFLTLLFGIILGLISVTIENVRYLTGNVYVHTAAEAAALAVFGEYNLELYEEYGLFAYGGYGRKNSQELAQNLLKQLQCALDVSDEDKPGRTMDLYRISEVQCFLEQVQALTDEDVFHQQIEDYITAKGIKDLSQLLIGQYGKNSHPGDEKRLRDGLDMTDAYERGDYKKEDGDAVQTEDSSSEVSPVEQTEDNSSEKFPVEGKEDRAGGNPLETFQALLRDGILHLVCDVDSLEDGQGVKNSSKSTADLLKGILFGQENSLFSMPQNTKQKVGLLCYGNAVFSSYVTDKKRSIRCGLEYLATGEEEERDCLLGVVNKLLFVRTILNFAYVNTDSTLREESLATATVIAGLLEMPPLVTAIQQTILLILSVEESLIDITALLQGNLVPFTKTKETFQMSYYEICTAGKKLFAGKAKNYESSWGKFVAGYFDYTQYLWLFSLMNSEDILRERTFHLIEYDLRERFNQTFSLQQSIYGAKFSIRYSQPLLWSGFYGGDLAKERSVETWHSYG